LAAPEPHVGAVAVLPKLEHATILCIDNESGVLDGMRTLLGGWGCRTHLATGLADAIKIDRAMLAQFDMMIVDYHLDADADGLQCVDALRQHCGAALPAIMITADRSASVRAAALARGLHVLNKPIKPAAMRALISRIIATHQAAQ
jgi:CheY-like chemotaxis protein